jgi:CIC family chloride channel protein
MPGPMAVPMDVSDAAGADKARSEHAPSGVSTPGSPPLPGAGTRGGVSGGFGWAVFGTLRPHRLLEDPAARLMVAGVLIGAASGAAAGALDGLIRVVARATLGTDEASVAAVPPLVALVVPVLGGLVAGALVALGTQQGAGLGIADVMGAVSSQKLVLRLRDGVATALAAVAAVGSGHSGGRESPIVQLGAAVASRVCRALDLPARDARVLVAGGAAAGIAASFNTPIGAAFFAMEIVLGNFAMRLFAPVVAATVTGTVVGQALLGQRRTLSLPAFGLAHPGELPLYLLLGLVAGGVAVVFKRTLHASRARLASLPIVVRPVVAGAAVGMAGALGVTAVMGNGYPFVEAVLSGTRVLPVAPLAAMLALKLVLSALTSGSGGGSGVFAPTLVIGALTGALVGEVLAGLGLVPMLSVGAFGTVGMGAVAAAVTHAPITMALMLFEMTGNYEIVLPLLLSLSVAGLVDAALDGDGLFQQQLTARGVALRHGREQLVLYDLKVSDLVREDVPVLEVDAPFAALARTLIAHRLDAVLVRHADGTYAGLVPLHDVKSHLADGGATLVAGDLIAAGVPTARPDQPVAEVLPLFSRADLDDLPVVDEAGRPVGLLRERDILAAYHAEVLGHDELLVRVKSGEEGGEKHFFELPPGVGMASVAVTAALAGRTLRELDLPRQHGCTVVAAVQRAADGRETRVVPSADLVVREGDRLVLLGPTAAVAQLAEG